MTVLQSTCRRLRQLATFWNLLLWTSTVCRTSWIFLGPNWWCQTFKASWDTCGPGSRILPMHARLSVLSFRRHQFETLTCGESLFFFYLFFCCCRVLLYYFASSWWSFREVCCQLYRLWPRLQEWLQKEKSNAPVAMLNALSDDRTSLNMFLQLLVVVFLGKEFQELTYKFECDSFITDQIHDG